MEMFQRAGRLMRWALVAGLAAGCAGGPGPGGTGSSSSSSTSSGSGGTGSSGAGGNVHVVTGEVNGSVTGSDLGAALQWHAYNQDLLDCLAPLEVNPPLNPDDPSDQYVMQELALCAHLHAYGRVAADGVPLDPTSATFQVPISQVPAPALLTTGTGSEFGLGAVVVFRDGNGNTALDMVAPGAQESVDTILGASVAVDENATQDMMVLYRGGELSPLWKLFQGMYDCTTEPPQGFSILRVSVDELTGLFRCDILVDGVVDVALRNSDEMRSLICLPGAEGPPFRYPDEPLPADAVAQCYGAETVYFTTTPGSPCPIVERYDLIGCHDPSSPDACRASTWDITATPPGWWPCTGSGGAGASIVLVDAPGDVTDAADNLFRLEHRGGTFTAPVEALRVDVVVNDAGLTLSLGTEGLLLQDNDGNSVFSAGDALVVSEEGVSLFGTATEPGIYPVSLVDTRVTPARHVGQGSWMPRPLPAPLGAQPFELVIEDDPAVLTEGPDVLFTARFEDAERSLPLADIRVEVMDGCEPPVAFAGSRHLSLVADNDGNWNRGDRLQVRESDDVQMWGLGGAYAFNHCVSVELRRGFNHYERVAWGWWDGLRVEGRDDPAPLTAGADVLLTVTITAGHARVPMAGLHARIYAYDLNGQQEVGVITASEGGVVLTEDGDADGLFGLGDVVTVSEVTPLAGLETDGQEYYVYLQDEAFNMVGYVSWTSGTP